MADCIRGPPPTATMNVTVLYWYYLLYTSFPNRIPQRIFFLSSPFSDSSSIHSLTSLALLIPLLSPLLLPSFPFSSSSFSLLFFHFFLFASSFSGVACCFVVCTLWPPSMGALSPLSLMPPSSPRSLNLRAWSLLCSRASPSGRLC